MKDENEGFIHGSGSGIEQDSKSKRMEKELNKTLSKGFTCAELCGVDAKILTEVESNNPQVSRQVEIKRLNWSVIERWGC